MFNKKDLHLEEQKYSDNQSANNLISAKTSDRGMKIFQNLKNKYIKQVGELFQVQFKNNHSNHSVTPQNIQEMNSNSKS